MIPPPGAVVLLRLPVSGGTVLRLRPALVLGLLPGPFQSVLVCGIGTARLDELTTDWDELFAPGDADFEDSGLRQRSAARLSFLFSVTEGEVEGVIGSVDEPRLSRARERLAHHLLEAPEPATGS